MLSPNKYARALLLLLLLQAWGGVSAALAQTMRVIPLTSVVPNWLSLDEIWEGVGLDGQGRVYVGVSAYFAPTTIGDVGLYRYDPALDLPEFLTSARTVAANAGNLQSGERIAKVHTEWVLYQGKLYLGTHDFHGGEDPQSIRGCHLLVYDPASGTWDDLSRFMPGGVAVPHEGFVGLDIATVQGVAIGNTFPYGSLVTFNLTTHATTVVSAPVHFEQVGRDLFATTAGFGYWTYLESYTDLRGLFRAIDATTSALRVTSQRTTLGIIHSHVTSADQTRVWFLDEYGYIYRWDVASESVTPLGRLVPDADWAAYGDNGARDSLALSNDEQRLFTFLGGNSSLYSYTIATGARANVATFQGGSAWGPSVNGMTIDHQGNIYIVDHSYQANGARLIQFSGVPGSPPRQVMPARRRIPRRLVTGQ